MLIKGADLTPRQYEQVLNAFVYRWTTGNPHRAQVYGVCPHCGVLGGEPSEDNVACRQVHPTVPLQTDNEWVKDHAFHFVADGSRLMQRRNACVPAYVADGETK